MRMSTSIGAVIAATLLASSAPARQPAAPTGKERAEASAKKVKELRKERIAVLKKMTEQLTALYKQARATDRDALEAAQLLFDAELEIAESDKERVALYQKLIDVLKQHESVAEAKWKAGRGTEANVLKWKAKRLDAEIRLEQVKLKAATAGR